MDHAGLVFLAMLVVGGLAGALAHEAFHGIAAVLSGMSVKAIHVGMGREIRRVGPVPVLRMPVVIHVWPVAIGVEIDDDALMRLPVWLRVANHMSGPMANLLLAAILWRAAPVAAIANALLFVFNALPLPRADGGWAATALLAKIRGVGMADEIRWHERAFTAAWTAVYAAVALGLIRLAI